ncbi:30S ribosomal protein S17 [Planctomicrobium piriforme]|uniref:Small ribosomal subunit protein uS17 n=1 Tax=Planctomicrobium piriforme TaxID=1576369 RepID=A0A1I3C7V5_9PLAN|nr:30S ribosomal protein S17 [Planctomicrobium piriforme]SFH70406.1 small subunit ribosomal protein S17 [Planctomicrobium piriforme]
MRKTLVGTVVSDRNAKTRRVDVSRVYQHTKYKKIVRGRTVCYVHDEKNESKVGDTVEIAECRPRSALKRWELVKIVSAVGELESQLTRETIEAAKARESESTEVTAP